VASRRTGKRRITDVRVTARARPALAPAGVARLAAAALRAARGRVSALSVSFVGTARIRTLNRVHRGKDHATDVIAFAMSGPADGGPGAPVVGDIYICPALAMRNARRAGTSVKDELRRLVVHGVLHVLGWDHPAGAAARLASPMWRLQERIVAAHGRLAR